MKRIVKNPTRDDLIAYLDGELDEAEADRVERALSLDSNLQIQADALSRTFEMLDALSPPRASHEFTQRTLDAVHVPEASAIEDQDVDLDAVTLPARKQLSATKIMPTPTTPVASSAAFMSFWAAGLVVSAAVGFLITNQWIPGDTQNIRRDLPLIERLDLIRSVGDLEFIKSLEQRGFEHRVPAANGGPVNGPDGFRQPRDSPGPLDRHHKPGANE